MKAQEANFSEQSSPHLFVVLDARLQLYFEIKQIHESVFQIDVGVLELSANKTEISFKRIKVFDGLEN